LLDKLDMEPKLLWNHFDEIRKIPRGSKNEDRMRQYLISVAEKNGFERKVDEAGNLLIKVPAKPGLESRPIIVLQGHMDMVNEKNSDVDHDFENDSLKVEMDGEYLTAVGTTLGADNGVGIAAALAVAEDPEVQHGPLELLFTVDEETGLTGAFAMKGDLMEGRILINTDAEEWGAMFVGCAGGAESMIKMPFSREDMPQGWTLVRLIASGMKGGHSGVDIQLQRANASKVLARCIWSANREMDLRLACFKGGSKHNAIPREARALVAVEASGKQAFLDHVTKTFEIQKVEFKSAEAGMEIAFEETEPVAVLSKENSEATLKLLVGLPHGVLVNSYDIPDLIQTSTTMAIVDSQEDGMTITMSSRSSVDSEIKGVRDRIAAIALMAGAAVEEPPGYPGWKPDLESNVLARMKECYKEIWGEEPGVKAIHAGLECGIIGEKFPGMDMVAVGPQLEFPHSPDERVHVGTVEKFYTLVAKVLASY